MKPIIFIRDYYFNLGEEYVNEDNAENVIWWSYNYARMYGFATGDKNNVYAINKLDIQLQKELRNKMYNHIVKLGQYGVKGIYSIENTDPLKDMTDLVSGYIFEISKMYEGENNHEKAKKFYLDTEQHQKLQDIYKYYHQASKKSLLALEKKHYHHLFRFRILQFIIFGKIYRNSPFPKALCKSQFLNDYIHLFNELIQWSNDTNNTKTQGEIRLSKLFNKIALSSNPNKISTQILLDIKDKCTNYPQANEFLKLKQGNI